MNKPEIHPDVAMVNALGGDQKLFELRQRLVKLVSDQLGVPEGEITDSAKFVEDLGCDSLDTVEMVMAVEDEFGIEVPDEDAEKMVDLASVVAYAPLRRAAGLAG